MRLTRVEYKLEACNPNNISNNVLLQSLHMRYYNFYKDSYRYYQNIFLK